LAFGTRLHTGKITANRNRWRKQGGTDSDGGESRGVNPYYFARKEGGVEVNGKKGKKREKGLY